MFGALSVAKVPMPEVARVNETFPLLASGKLLDEDVLVHSTGCSVWNTFGHEQSFMAVVECPARGQLVLIFVLTRAGFINLLHRLCV